MNKTAQQMQFFFVERLLDWNERSNQRQMPWKGEKNPYRIWLSEIILQQTRVEQGLGYYQRFIQQYPDIHQLAAAPVQEVFKLWEGLGYYSRCKNLLASAVYIVNECGGVFPQTYAEILKMKGVGPYTAAAIASFAFNLPHAVLDGNVFRVLARFFGVSAPIDSTAGKKIFTSLADELLPAATPALYNQAIMDFGAVVCKPQLPGCSSCPLQKKCVAYAEKKVQQLPVKEKTIVKKERWFYYLVIEQGNGIYVRQRPAGDIWENLYDFVLLETAVGTTPEALLASTEVLGLLGRTKYEVLRISPLYQQQLTHQTIRGQFIRLRLTRPVKIAGYQRMEASELPALPFPKFITYYLTDKKLTLNL